MDVRASLEIALDPSTAFDAVVDELRLGLERQGLRLDDNRVREGDAEIGQVVAWERGKRIALRWWPAPWQPDTVTDVEVGFEAHGHNTQVTLEHRGWDGAIGDDKAELAGWFAGEVLAPLLRATAPVAFGDWLTDRVARRPTGEQAREVYRDPLYHWPNFRVLLDELALTPDDFLLEVGSGGGAFLYEALESGCRAAAIDHSADMVRLASEVNLEAIEAGRLEIREASADRLPFDDERFTAAVMTGVLGFLPDPVKAFAEIRRVLIDGGRLAALGSDPEMRGTPAAPEPMASRLHFYDDEELEGIARKAVHGRACGAARPWPLRGRSWRSRGAPGAVLGRSGRPLRLRAERALFAGIALGHPSIGGSASRRRRRTLLGVERSPLERRPQFPQSGENVSASDHRAPSGPGSTTPPGAFVSGEHRDDCARFLAETRELAKRRALQLLDSPANRRNTVTK